MTTTTVDAQLVEAKVRHMYELVATDPHGSYHFETGRGLAGRLGYEPAVLDLMPAAAVDSFAEVGCFFDLADLTTGERVLDLGSGSGMDSFIAGHQVGGRVSLCGNSSIDLGQVSSPAGARRTPAGELTLRAGTVLAGTGPANSAFAPLALTVRAGADLVASRGAARFRVRPGHADLASGSSP